jgi:hypothetical protein
MMAKLRRGSIVGEVSSVKNSFSSWSNCMNASYCKFVSPRPYFSALLIVLRWPVIIAIIIISLILLSIVTCIIRCACCGMSCCCSCFSFLKCCDCCGDSCAGKKDKPMKHLDDPYAPPARHGYQAPAPMMAGGLNKPEPPQYAQFEVGKNGLAVDPKANALSEDALPPMPSWETAAERHVLTEEEEKNAVELGELDPVTGQKVPLMTGAAATGTSMPPSPVHGQSPYGVPGQAVLGNGYSDNPGDRYAQRQNSLNGRGYGGSPAPGNRYGQNQNGFNGNGRDYGGPGRGYGQSPPNLPDNFDGQGHGYSSDSPDHYEADNGFAGAAVGGYGARPFPPQPTRQYSSDSSRPLNPGRQYSDRPYQNDNFQPNGPPPRGPLRGPGGPGRKASPPLNNNSGFDFGTGPQQYQSRPSPPPQQMSYGSSSEGRPSPPIQGRTGGNDGYFGGSTAPPSYASRSPPPQEPSYPGYRPYQPNYSQSGRGAPPSLIPGGGRGGREPQGWDPVHQ